MPLDYTRICVYTVSAIDIQASRTKINGSKLTKMEKSRFLTRHCHKIYRIEAVGLSIHIYTLSITNFYEYLKF